MAPQPTTSPLAVFMKQDGDDAQLDYKRIALAAVALYLGYQIFQVSYYKALIA